MTSPPLKIHFYPGKGFTTICGLLEDSGKANNRTNSVTRDKDEVTCPRCLRRIGPNFEALEMR